MGFVHTDKENDQYTGLMYKQQQFFDSYKCCRDCLVFAMCLEFHKVSELGTLWDSRKVKVIVKKPCFKFELTRAYYQPEYKAFVPKKFRM